MKHRVKSKQFNRDTNSRKALFKNLLRGLFEHGAIKTSEARAKEIKRLADKIVSNAMENTVATRRNLHEIFGRRDVVNTLVEKIAPAMNDRKSGFTTIEKLAPRRGDNTVLYKLSLMVKEKTWTSFKKEEVVATKETAATKETVKEVVKTEVKKAVAKKKTVAKKAVAKSKESK
jgi:large subunit ribosomal protein L17